ncbi:MAG: GNAT family N-acetyltransferase [Lachnospiraceae bacterium]|nr:GNAT family N-acetyltransferase [Lachnospiraceae bacterium]
MEFKYILIKKDELYEEAIPEDFLQLFLEVEKYAVKILEYTGSIPWNEMRKQKIYPEDMLLIAATDATLKEIENLPVASIGYVNPKLKGQSLFAADILVEGFGEVDYWFLERIYQRKHHIPWRVIDTGRCYLREMTEEDLPELFELYAGKGMTDYMEPLFEWEEELEYTRAYIANMYRFYGYGMWLVMQKKTDKLIGRAGLNHLEFEGEMILEMGYAIGVSYQKNGYATEVCDAVIAYAKGADLGYEKLHCFVWKGNQASINLLKKLGFSFVKNVVRDGKEMLLYIKSLV